MSYARVLAIWLACTFVALALMQPHSSAGETSPQEVSAPEGDVQDLLVLGPTRPLFIRLRITIDGRPFREVWQERFDELFAGQDRAGDGRVSLEQAELLARDMNGGVRGRQPSTSGATSLRSQAADDGTVDRKTLSAYVQSVLPQLSLYSRPLITRSAGLALFPLLDTDQDYQLSPAELSAAERQVKERDFNDDGAVTAFELILDPSAIADAADPDGGSYGTPQDEPVLLLGPAAATDATAKRLVARYDKNDDGELGIAKEDREVALPESIAAALDRDGDGRLSQAELTRFADRAADVELSAALGQVTAAQRRTNRQRVKVEPGWRVRQKLLRGYDLSLGDVEIDLTLDNRNPEQADLYSFTVVDRDDNEYVDLQEAQASQIGADAFAAMDTDGDKKVFEGEFNSFLTEQTGAAAVRLQMQVFDRGQDLFSLLDIDVNGILSPRELSTAADIIAVVDENGDGVLNGSEIPQRLMIELVRGADPPPDEARLTTGHIAISTDEALSTGPLWFRKMDRNNDADLSPREFVGTPDKFRQIDADGNGLIDAEEAAAADK